MGRVAGFIHEMLGEHRMCGLGNAMAVGRRAVDLDADEPVAEFTTKRFEPIGRTHWVLGETQSENTDTRVDPFLDDLQLERADAKVGLVFRRQRERRRRLRQNRGHHFLIDHHCQREAAGKTHANRTDAGPTAFAMQIAGKGPQPYDDFG